MTQTSTSVVREDKIAAPTVHVIVINWNGEADTINCLQSLLEVEYDEMHVVVSDNGSRPESIRAIREWAGERGLRVSATSERPVRHPESRIRSLCLIESGRNLGFTGANTVGIEYALAHGSDYVLFFNNDALATPQFLARMVALAESDASYGVIGCKTFYAQPDPGSGRHRIWSLGGYEYVFGNPMNRGRNQYDRPEWTGVLETDLVCGCCMLIKRKVVDTVGVQDDRLFFAIDDVEYSMRAASQGWRNALALDAEIYHEGSASAAGRSGLQLYYLYRNTYYFRAKYFPWYRNVVFFAHHLSRYVVAGGIAKLLRGAGRANVGMLLGLYDFVTGRMGECPHPALVRRR